MKKSAFIIGIFISFQLLIGCQYWEVEDDYFAPDASTLVVHIYGVLSGVDRDNIAVTLHWTKEDAERNINPITERAYTDSYGEVVFYDLPPNENYWVRGKALLAKTIRPTNPLYIGENYIEIPIL